MSLVSNFGVAHSEKRVKWNERCNNCYHDESKVLKAVRYAVVVSFEVWNNRGSSKITHTLCETVLSVFDMWFGERKVVFIER